MLSVLEVIENYKNKEIDFDTMYNLIVEDIDNCGIAILHILKNFEIAEYERSKLINYLFNCDNPYILVDLIHECGYIKEKIKILDKLIENNEYKALTFMFFERNDWEDALYIIKNIKCNLKNKNYIELISKIFNIYCDMTNDDNRELMFSELILRIDLIQNIFSKIYMSYRYNHYLRSFTEKELRRIYDKYKTELFNSKLSLGSYFNNCMIFYRWIGAEQRELVVKKIVYNGDKEKAHKLLEIPHYKDKLHITGELVDRLEAFLVMDKIIA